MAFAIKFTDDPLEYLGDDATVPSAVGRIVLGDWQEEFVSSLYEWDQDAYRTQWLSALQALLSGERAAALITEYLSPDVSSHLVWWKLYRGSADTVYVQNQLLFYDGAGRGFSVTDAASYLGQRRTHGEDGDAISEWQVSLQEIASFLENSER